MSCIALAFCTAISIAALYVQAGLTRKLALIQGPPGTGKTYVGIQVVKALLANTHGHVKSPEPGFRQRGPLLPAAPPHPSTAAQPELTGPSVGPILIVCYTNHALDQFLEGLLAAGLTGLVRVGGRY